jgi:hypothetical protein
MHQTKLRLLNYQLNDQAIKKNELLSRSISRGGTGDDQRSSGDDDANGAADPEKTAYGAEED